MKNIFLVPTKEHSDLFYDKEELYYNTALYKIPLLRKNQYIYITSGKKAKLGGYAIGTEGRWKHLVTKITGSPVADIWEEIILTNDEKLIKDGIQCVPNDFFNWFVKNSSFEFVEVEKMLQNRHGVDWHDLPNQSEGRDPEGIYRKIHKIILPEEKSFNSNRGLIETQLNDPNQCEHFKEVGCIKDVCDCYTLQESKMHEASMKYLSKCVADGNRFTGYADEDFREGYKYREQEEIDLAKGYLSANLENVEKMKSMFDMKNVQRIAEHFYYKGVKKASHPEVRFDFDNFIETFQKK